MRTAIGVSVAALAVLAAACTSAPSREGQPPSVDRPLHARMDPRQVVSPTSGPRESTPPALAHARGTFTGSLNTRSQKLSWSITYAGLGIPAVVIADVHYGEPGQFGALLVRLCGPCRSMHPTGVVTVSASAVPMLLKGGSWVTIITNSYPNGAIRGQIKAGAARF